MSKTSATVELVGNLPSLNQLAVSSFVYSFSFSVLILSFLHLWATFRLILCFVFCACRYVDGPSVLAGMHFALVYLRTSHCRAWLDG